LSQTPRDLGDTRFRPVIGPGHTLATITDEISRIVLKRSTPVGWWIATGIAALGVALMLTAIAWLLLRGVGIWGLNTTVGWGSAIICFVWWIGIGHAGTLISAILLLLRQQWRTSINRFAEAMTLFAVMCAGIFPLLHVGRPWLAYWLLPYPNTMNVWPQFRSPLLWDVFAVSTYATVSALFWYVGLIPDMASLRDRAKSPFFKVVYGIMAMGWRGAARHWERYETAYLLLAGLATPLVVSVHTVVSFDFAVGIIPGWHATIMPPYFVAGAIYSGFAMVMTLAIPLRKFYRLEDFITLRHLENMSKVMLATGLIVCYGYAMEAFFAWYSGSEYEEYMILNRITGPYWWAYSLLLFCNLVTPQLLWFRRIRRAPLVLFIVSIVVNVGMWLERFVIVVTSLHRDYLPSAWDMSAPTFWDWARFGGTLGFFVFMVLLFIRFLPMISMFEMRTLVPATDEEGQEPGARAGAAVSEGGRA